MKKYLFSLLILLSVCSFVQAQNIDVSETRSLPSFRKIKSGGAIEVVAINGTQESAKITAKNVGLDDIITEVRGGELVLKTTNKKYRNNTKIKIEVTYLRLEAIDISGASSFSTENVVKAENFSINLSGASTASLPVESIKLTVDVSGASSLTIKGKTDQQNIEVSGAAVYKGYELASLNTKARISGAGAANVSVSGNLEANVDGAGNLRYKGTPTNKEIHKSGAGSVHAKE